MFWLLTVEELGGKCLPCIVDIRHEEDVEKAVQSAVAKFGGIDILVNNASAISLTGTVATPMKKYDLMMGVNGRGTYLWYLLCNTFLTEIKVKFVTIIIVQDFVTQL